MALQTESGRTKPAKELDGPLAFTQDKKRQLRDMVKRAEHIETELEAVNEDKNALFEEIEEAGFDKKLVKRVVKARKMSAAEREYDQERFQYYLDCVGEN